MPRRRPKKARPKVAVMPAASSSSASTFSAAPRTLTESAMDSRSALPSTTGGSSVASGFTPRSMSSQTTAATTSSRTTATSSGTRRSGHGHRRRKSSRVSITLATSRKLLKMDTPLSSDQLLELDFKNWKKWQLESPLSLKDTREQMRDLRLALTPYWSGYLMSGSAEDNSQSLKAKERHWLSQALFSDRTVRRKALLTCAIALADAKWNEVARTERQFEEDFKALVHKRVARDLSSRVDVEAAVTREFQHPFGAEKGVIPELWLDTALKYFVLTLATVRELLGRRGAAAGPQTVATLKKETRFLFAAWDTLYVFMSRLTILRRSERIRDFECEGRVVTRLSKEVTALPVFAQFVFAHFLPTVLMQDESSALDKRSGSRALRVFLNRLARATPRSGVQKHHFASSIVKLMNAAMNSTGINHFGDVPFNPLWVERWNVSRAAFIQQVDDACEQLNEVLRSGALISYPFGFGGTTEGREASETSQQREERQKAKMVKLKMKSILKHLAPVITVLSESSRTRVAFVQLQSTGQLFADDRHPVVADMEPAFGFEDTMHDAAAESSPRRGLRLSVTTPLGKEATDGQKTHGRKRSLHGRSRTGSKFGDEFLDAITSHANPKEYYKGIRGMDKAKRQRSELGSPQPDEYSDDDESKSEDGADSGGLSHDSELANLHLKGIYKALLEHSSLGKLFKDPIAFRVFKANTNLVLGYFLFPEHAIAAIGSGLAVKNIGVALLRSVKMVRSDAEGFKEMTATLRMFADCCVFLEKRVLNPLSAKTAANDAFFKQVPEGIRVYIARNLLQTTDFQAWAGHFVRALGALFDLRKKHLADAMAAANAEVEKQRRAKLVSFARERETLEATSSMGKARRKRDEKKKGADDESDEDTMDPELARRKANEETQLRKLDASLQSKTEAVMAEKRKQLEDSIFDFGKVVAIIERITAEEKRLEKSKSGIEEEHALMRKLGGHEMDGDEDIDDDLAPMRKPLLEQMATKCSPLMSSLKPETGTHMRRKSKQDFLMDAFKEYGGGVPDDEDKADGSAPRTRLTIGGGSEDGRVSKKHVLALLRAMYEGERERGHGAAVDGLRPLNDLELVNWFVWRQKQWQTETRAAAGGLQKDATDLDLSELSSAKSLTPLETDRMETLGDLASKAAAERKEECDEWEKDSLSGSDRDDDDNVVTRKVAALAKDGLRIAPSSVPIPHFARIHSLTKSSTIAAVSAMATSKKTLPPPPGTGASLRVPLREAATVTVMSDESVVSSLPLDGGILPTAESGVDLSNLEQILISEVLNIDPSDEVWKLQHDFELKCKEAAERVIGERREREQKKVATERLKLRFAEMFRNFVAEALRSQKIERIEFASIEGSAAHSLFPDHAAAVIYDMMKFAPILWREELEKTYLDILGKDGVPTHEFEGLKEFSRVAYERLVRKREEAEERLRLEDERRRRREEAAKAQAEAEAAAIAAVTEAEKAIASAKKKAALRKREVAYEIHWDPIEDETELQMATQYFDSRMYFDGRPEEFLIEDTDVASFGGTDAFKQVFMERKMRAAVGVLDDDPEYDSRSLPWYERELFTWTVDDVVSWAKARGCSEQSCARLYASGLNGHSLFQASEMQRLKEEAATH